MPRYMKMIVSVTEADNFTMHLIVVWDLTDMFGSLNLRSVIALRAQLQTSQIFVSILTVQIAYTFL